MATKDALLTRNVLPYYNDSRNNWVDVGFQIDVGFYFIVYFFVSKINLNIDFSFTTLFGLS